jgi:hypothetical protein
MQSGDLAIMRKKSYTILIGRVAQASHSISQPLTGVARPSLPLARAGILILFFSDESAIATCAASQQRWRS